MLSITTQAKIELYNKKRDAAIQHVVNYYTTIKKRNMYNPSVNNKKYLTIIAAHVHTKMKLATLINNVRTIDYDCNDIIIINSQGLPFNNQVRTLCDKRNIKYIEVDNIPSLDFGKWLFTLKNSDCSNYDYIIFTNDSYTIHKPMHHFYNLTSKMNVELYGYNDSTEGKYHYQSYLFSIRKDAIQKFIDNVESKIHHIGGWKDVVANYEINLVDWFQEKDCFLKIGNEFYNKRKNIFIRNDYFYSKLFSNRLLPFTKIKRG
jgi:hypothetical protein